MNPVNNVLFSSDLWLLALERYASDTHLTVKLFGADERVVFGPVHSTPMFQLFEEKGYDPGIFAECARRCLAQTDTRPAVVISEVYGLTVVGTSLALEGKVVGAAVGGYAFADFSQLSEVQRLAKDAGIQFERLWQVAREQKPVPQQRLILNGELLQVLGDALLRENHRTRQYEEIAVKLEEAAKAKNQAHHELHRTTSALRESEEHYRTLFELGPVAVYSCDASGVIQEFNNRAKDLWGRTPVEGDTDERFCGSFKLFRPDGSFMPHEQCPMAEVVSGRISEARDGEVLIERPDGTRVTVIVNIRPLKNERGDIVGAINCFYDISERKRAEDALQLAHDELESQVQRRTGLLRQLSTHLQHVQDDERRRIARELHDSTQYLAALKMNLARLDQRDLTNKKSLLAESNEMLDKCLAEIRTMSYLLHPPMLDESGLASAATWYVEGFAKRSGIQTDLAISPRLDRLPRDVEMVLFRALQESLTNVHRHSHSPKVDIRIQIENGHASLAVKDYGKGFGREQLEMLGSGCGVIGVGLTGMRERVNELGGVLDIRAEKPGTSVTVTLPIAKAEARAAHTLETSTERESAA